MVKVIVADGIDPEGLGTLVSNRGFEITYVKESSELDNVIADADALLVRSKTKVNTQLLEKGKNLKFVGRAGVGVDNIDVNVASKRGILVANVPGGNTISAAEHTFALILALSRNIPQSDSSVRKGFWERDKFVGTELQGKTLGLFGFGRIGREVARRGIVFGMNVLAYDPYVSEEHLKSLGVGSASQETIFAQADYISLHLPATDQTQHFINEKTLNLMKPEARLINCARGSLIDETALINGLKAGKIKGAALDVFSSEPPKNNELFALPNLILTPHLGASTEEAQTKVAQDLSISLVEFFEKGLVRNAVNLPSVDKETLEKITPYLKLAERMGQFLSQIALGGVREVHTEFFGEFSGEMRHLLSLSVLQGILSTALGKKEINWVNANTIAKERGIRVEERAIALTEDFTSLIQVKIRTDKVTKSVAGTIFSRNIQKIVRIDGLSVDVMPDGHLLVFTNVDKPGVVGTIGNILGDNKINIAEFQVGRKSIGGEAVSVIKVDSPVPPAVVEKIKSNSFITNLWLVDLS